MLLSVEGEVRKAKERLLQLKKAHLAGAGPLVERSFANHHDETLQAQNSHLKALVAEKELQLGELQQKISEQLAQASEAFKHLQEKNVSAYHQDLLFRYTNNDANVIDFLDSYIVKLQKKRISQGRKSALSRLGFPQPKFVN